MKTRKWLAFTTLALVAAVVRAQSATTSSATAETTQGLCYYPLASGGQQAPDNVPCEPNSTISMCCPAGWTCMSSHVCVVTDTSAVTPGSDLTVGALRRPTCTDPDWGLECGNYCLSLPAGDPGDLTACGNNVFACQAFSLDHSANCTAKQNVFTLPTGTALTIIAVPTGGVSTLPSSASASSAESLTTTSTASLATSIANSTANSTETSIPISTPEPTPPPQKKSHKLAIGLGAGLGAGGVIAIAAIIFLCIHLRNKKKEQLRKRQYEDTKAISPAPHDHVVDEAPVHHVNPNPHPVTVPPMSFMPHSEPRAPEFNADLYDDGHNNITNTTLAGAESRGGLSGRASPFGADGPRFDDDDRGYEAGRFAHVDV